MGRPISELKNSMSNPEFVSWIAFYKDFPFDDFHRYQRPSALVSAAVSGKVTNESVDKLLAWLQPEQIPEGMNLADYNTLKALGGKI